MFLPLFKTDEAFSLVQPSRCVNQIDVVCETIEKTINQAVQKTLDQLEKDSDLICSTISSRLEQDRLLYVLNAI